jgi:hypothetical protein
MPGVATLESIVGGQNPPSLVTQLAVLFDPPITISMASEALSNDKRMRASRTPRAVNTMLFILYGRFTTVWYE